MSIYVIIRQDFIFFSFWLYNSANKFLKTIFCLNWSNSIPAMMKHEFHSHKIALYKNAVNSSIVVSLLQNKIYWALGFLLVRYL